MPITSGAITSTTLLTACRTPLPPYRDVSPSRSSTASCTPVLAPLGMMAWPSQPLASST